MIETLPRLEFVVDDQFERYRPDFRRSRPSRCSASSSTLDLIPTTSLIFLSEPETDAKKPRSSPQTRVGCNPTVRLYETDRSSSSRTRCETSSSATANPTPVLAASV